MTTKTVQERVETLLKKTKVTELPLILDSLVRWKRKEVEKIVASYKRLPEGERRAIGVAANLMLTLLENKLASSPKKRRRKK